jgi:hypothetical protein
MRTNKSYLALIFRSQKFTLRALEKDSVQYILERAEEDSWADYDPDAALEGIKKAAGSRPRNQP